MHKGFGYKTSLHLCLLPLLMTTYLASIILFLQLVADWHHGMGYEKGESHSDDFLHLSGIPVAEPGQKQIS
jgi:hypothetical protein